MRARHADRLSAWWSWPDRGRDGELDERVRWKRSFPYEQVAMNGYSRAGVLHEDAAQCVRVVPSSELFMPGRRVAHFTGPCRLAPQYEPADGTYLNFGPTRKCRCLLSHFGAATVARLFAAPSLNDSVCRRERREVVPPQWPPPQPQQPANRSARGASALTVSYTWHACGPAARTEERD